MDRDWISAYNICIINWIIFEWLSSQLDSTTGESTDMYVTMRQNLNKAKYNTIFCISISLLNKSSTLFWRTSRGTNDLSSYSFNAGYSVSISLSHDKSMRKSLQLEKSRKSFWIILHEELNDENVFVWNLNTGTVDDHDHDHDGVGVT